MGQTALWLRGIVEEISALTEGILPDDTPPCDLCHYYFAGVHGSSDPCDREDVEWVPRLSEATRKLGTWLSSELLERVCFELEWAGIAPVALSLRQKIAVLQRAIQSTEADVVSSQNAATRGANQAVFRCLGGPDPDPECPLISWSEISVGSSLQRPIPGGPQKRRDLAAWISRGPPPVQILEMGEPSYDQPRLAAQYYWAALNHSDAAIWRLRRTLRDAVERFCADLSRIAERLEGGVHAPDPHREHAGDTARDARKTGERTSLGAPPSGSEQEPPRKKAAGARRNSKSGGKSAAGKSTRSESGGSPSAPRSGLSPDVFMSELEIAREAGVNQDTLRKRLPKWRQSHNNNDWTQVANPRPRDPRYLYRWGSLQPLLDDLRRTARVPAKKNTAH
jgi:hypothetical protein